VGRDAPNEPALLNHTPPVNWQEKARRGGLGRAAYLLWYLPAGLVKRSAAAGGPLAQWRSAREAASMERAAATLPTSRVPAVTDTPELHFLTGKKFWYQTAFCLHTLQAHSASVFRAVFHDDGSLDDDDAARLKTLFPASEVRRRAENDARVAELLPPSRFPALHAERARPYPNFLKLTDVHAGQRGWRLVLDSDMLFFRRPHFLLAWLAAPDRPLWMLDVDDAYGYPFPAMAALAGAPVPRHVNVGFCGLDSSKFDWERLEHWAQTLLRDHGSRYYLEQALSAMMFAGQPGAVLPAEDYVVMPGEQECRDPHAVLHHYVAGSKRGYFRHGWRVARARATAFRSPA
jgi:hypothetical protein